MFNLELEQLKENMLYRECRSFPSEGTIFCSNDYLGLSSDSRLVTAAQQAASLYGVGSSGSRLTTGTLRIHTELEKEIAVWKKQERAIVFATGYMANVGVLSALGTKETVIFSDEKNHASIIDGCRLSKAKTVIYKHCDMSDLSDKIRSNPGLRKIIVTDTVFSMDGDIAPLTEIIEIAKKFQCIVMTDDAHGTGVYGESGSGVLEELGLEKEVHIQMGTFSKALGCEGAYVAGSEDIICYLINKARSFIFSTAPSPMVIGVIKESIHLVKEMQPEREKLRHVSHIVRKRLQENRFNVPTGNSTIIPLILGEEERTLKYSEELLKRGYYVSAIRPPTVAKGTSRLRITLSSQHTSEQIEGLIHALLEVKQLES